MRRSHLFGLCFASTVYLVHRRDSLRASKIMAERTLAHAKIKPVWDTAVMEVLDVKQDKVTGVRLKNLKTGEESVLPCAGVFVAIGHVPAPSSSGGWWIWTKTAISFPQKGHRDQCPNTQLFKGVIDMDHNGYIIPKKGTATNIPGVFVAGDCSDHVYRQAITAAGLGCAAAIDAERRLGEYE